MTTHDIELPPLPPLHIAPSVEPVDYPDVAQALMDYARTAIEADRKRHDRMLAHEWIRTALGLNDDVPYRFDFYAQEIEKLRNDSDYRKRRGEPWMPVESCPGGNGVRYLFIRDCGQGTLPAVEMGYMLDADTEIYMDSTHEPFSKYGYRVTHWTHLPGLPNTPQPAEPVKVGARIVLNS